jgi:Flp pilus assembly protein TadB
MRLPVKIDFGNLRGIEPSAYAIRFLVGGTTTALVGIVGKYAGPVVGGLFLAFPAILPATVTLIAKQERKKKHQNGLHGDRRALDAAALDANGAALGSVGLLGFAVVAWLLLPRWPAPLVLLIATAVWMLLALAAWLFRRYRHRLRTRAISGQNVRYRENSAQRDVRGR